MFGKRAADAPAKPVRPAERPRTAEPPPPISGAKAPPPPVAAARTVPPPAFAPDNRSEDYYQIKATIFSALIDTIDLA
ncbi:MAG: CpaF family protein, partial [Alphaproteobacteria bacterium]|nr:CpaF family protein [Alphaproteobacteria bacterium]